METRHVEKSVGAETTFEQDVADVEEVVRTVLGLAHKVAGRARRTGVRGRTISVKIRYGNFTTVNRSRTLVESTDVARDIHTVAADLLRANVTGAVRLVGVRLEGEQ